MTACPHCTAVGTRRGDYCLTCRWPFPGTPAWESYQQAQAVKSRHRTRTLLVIGLGVVMCAFLGVLLIYGSILAPIYHLPGLFD